MENTATGRSGDMNNGESSPNLADVWRNGYGFALLLLLVVGICLIIIGTSLFDDGTLANVILIGTGISMAPAAIVAALFRVFLFKEVQYQLTQPVIDDVNQRLAPKIMEQISELVAEYHAEIDVLKDLEEAGVIRPYRRRELALKDFASAIDTETDEIMIIGSSLKGLLIKEKYREIADKLKFKMDNKVRVKFLLTHPVIADLRAGQENRQFTEIGSEIIESLQILQKWQVPVEDVRLYKGTPTCFAIKTSSKMLLNPYPYGGVSYDSPCIIVETSAENPSYFYDEFDKSHFSTWETNFSARIYNYNDTVSELKQNLKIYADGVEKMLQA
jgi:hypothetical protein